MVTGLTYVCKRALVRRPLPAPASETGTAADGWLTDVSDAARTLSENKA